MRIVFMGTPDFAAVSLQRLLDERFDVVGVFTQPDKPKNRGMKLQPSPVKEIALAAGLPVFQPAKMRDGTALADLQSLRPDILVVVAYGRILPDDLLAVAPYGAVNVHGSLLPKYRGAAPIQWAVLNGDAVTGVSTMYLDREMDTGDVIYATQTPVGEFETAESSSTALPSWERICSCARCAISPRHRAAHAAGSQPGDVYPSAHARRFAHRLGSEPARDHQAHLRSRAVARRNSGARRADVQDPCGGLLRAHDAQSARNNRGRRERRRHGCLRRWADGAHHAAAGAGEKAHVGGRLPARAHAAR